MERMLSSEISRDFRANFVESLKGNDTTLFECFAEMNSKPEMEEFIKFFSKDCEAHDNRITYFYSNAIKYYSKIYDIISMGFYCAFNNTKNLPPNIEAIVHNLDQNNISPQYFELAATILHCMIIVFELKDDTQIIKTSYGKNTIIHKPITFYIAKSGEKVQFAVLYRPKYLQECGGNCQRLTHNAKQEVNDWIGDIKKIKNIKKAKKIVQEHNDKVIKLCTNNENKTTREEINKMQENASKEIEKTGMAEFIEYLCPLKKNLCALCNTHIGQVSNESDCWMCYDCIKM